MDDGSVKGVWEDYEHVRDFWMIERGRGMKVITPITTDELKPPKEPGGGFK